jgi:uncharacterized protein
VELLVEGSGPTYVFAHGAGAAMDSRGMTDLATRLVAHGLRVVRFEFGYMAARRRGVRRPPPRAEAVVEEYRAVLAEVGGRPVIGGRSMGGRVASMLADEAFAAGSVAGLACVSYPWHPPARPDQPRIAHLVGLRCPALVVQGTRDPFGSPEEIAGYGVPFPVELLADGDHDLRPRKAVSGFTHAQHLDTAARLIAAFAVGVEAV